MFLTDGVLDENHLVGLDEGSHANDVLCCDPEEVSLPVNETLDNRVVPGHRVGHRGPAHAIRLSLLYDIVGDGRATVVLRRRPRQFTRVVGQILSSKGKTHWARHI